MDLIKRLLRNGADAKATNNNGETALMFAARKGDDEMVEILLPKSDAKAVPNSGYTALMLAAKYGNVEMVERLLPKSDPKATNCTGGKKLPMILQKNTNAIKLLGFFNNTK